MNDYLEFTGRIEARDWGKSTYTLLRLPDGIAAALAAQGAKRVEGEINEHPVNLAPTRAPALEGTFLWTGKTLLRQIGLAPGDAVEVRLKKAPDGAVDLPHDLALALRAEGIRHFWEALTPGKQRGMIYQISTAKAQATRDRRITKLLSALGCDV